MGFSWLIIFITFEFFEYFYQVILFVRGAVLLVAVNSCMYKLKKVLRLLKECHIILFVHEAVL